MANYLILNQNQVFNGLGTLTYSVGTTEALNVQVQVTMPTAVAQNATLTENVNGISAGLLPGQLANGAGSGAGLGSGAGSSQAGDGFGDGDLGVGHGAVGQGFGTTYPYPQPPLYGSNLTANSPVTSQLSVLVKNNGVTIYTATTPAVAQGALQFKTSFLATSGDSVTVVLSSSASSDNQLSGVTSNISIGQGL